MADVVSVTIPVDAPEARGGRAPMQSQEAGRVQEGDHARIATHLLQLAPSSP